MIPVYVIDTSYLVELYRIPGDSRPEVFQSIRGRFRAAIEARGRLFVPVLGILELGNHLARSATRSQNVVFLLAVDGICN